MRINNLIKTPSSISYDVDYCTRKYKLVQYLVKTFTCLDRIEITRTEFTQTKYHVTESLEFWKIDDFPYRLRI